MILPELVNQVPEAPETFEKVDVDGISIYIDKMTYEKKPYMEVKLEKLLFLKRVVPHGINVVL